MGALFSRYLGPDWAEDPDHKRVWDQIDEIPGTELWRTHERCREGLVGYVRARLGNQLKRRGASTAEIIRAREVLMPEALTIGFARRFATYKRATLLFKDPERLARLLNNPERPVQLIIAGKAHPQDTEGKELIKQIIHLNHDERFRRKVVFIEDYNMDVTLHMVSGSDLWLNTPRRPLEACGTSGMKALANGSLNLSVLDGWWEEAYQPECGWALGHGEVYENFEIQDSIESLDLYNLLENDIVPLFYQRGIDGLPRGWIEKMRAGLRTLVPIYNSHRMVQEYLNRFYLPCSRRFTALSRDSFERAKDLASWRQKIMTGWAGVSVVEVTGQEAREIRVGESLEVKARVVLGSLDPEDVTVEAYFGRLGAEGQFDERDTVPLTLAETVDNVYLFEGKIPSSKSGRFGCTLRIMPSLERLENRFAMGLVTWA
jgi:starch phosphorylase